MQKYYFFMKKTWLLIELVYICNEIYEKTTNKHIFLKLLLTNGKFSK